MEAIMRYEFYFVKKSAFGLVFSSDFGSPQTYIGYSKTDAVRLYKSYVRDLLKVKRLPFSFEEC